MNLNEYQTEHGISDAQMCRILNESRPSPADPPVFEHRLTRLKGGKRATKLESYLIQVATDGHADRYCYLYGYNESLLDAPACRG